MLTVGSLFSGIGGLDLGLERAGMEVAWQCEADPYCRAVLRKHWPSLRCHEDVRTLHVAGDCDGHFPSWSRCKDCVYAVDVLAGGFPCQPVSYAGKRLAQEDIRWLWPYYAGLIRVLRPLYVVVENVPGLRTAGMGDVLGDLAGLGYDTEWESLPAATFGAPHLRDRVWLVAYRDGRGRSAEHGQQQAERAALTDAGSSGDVADATSPVGRRRSHEAREVRPPLVDQQEPLAGDGGGPVSDADNAGRIEQRRPESVFPPFAVIERDGWWRTEPDVGRMAHGVPSRVDRLRALGNAVVPQVAEYVGRQIMTAHLSVLDRTAEVSA